MQPIYDYQTQDKIKMTKAKKGTWLTKLITQSSMLESGSTAPTTNTDNDDNAAEKNQENSQADLAEDEQKGFFDDSIYH